ncbi:DUF5675 family protein [Gramella lutea]|uniref:DUF5675 family protein n=1 Tax=Christiangramia lutea TaxID=1607951 RepID=A0A9X2ACA8_9FLAO|nr:DUF5675 family protein [Christiangramia lutea]MCH4824292.1 DUF5675 family protein [Christiangramia lutea]
MKVLIERIIDDGTQTLGRLFVLDKNNAIKYQCDTLELSWKENKNRISCIPEGEYTVLKRFSKKFKNHFHITKVEGRSYILIHSGNFYSQILGCVLVGNDLKEINGDGRLDVVNSRETLADLLGILPGEFKLKIVKV